MSKIVVFHWSILQTRRQWIMVTCKDTRSNFPDYRGLMWLRLRLPRLFAEFSRQFIATPTCEQSEHLEGVYHFGCLDTWKLWCFQVGPCQSNRENPAYTAETATTEITQGLKERCHGGRTAQISQVSDAAKYRLCATCWPYWHTALPQWDMAGRNVIH